MERARKCPVCKKVVRGSNKSGVHSNCQGHKIKENKKEGVTHIIIEGDTAIKLDRYCKKNLIVTRKLVNKLIEEYLK